MECVSWYLLCLIFSYYDVCEELFLEEKRMYFLIVFIYCYCNVIVYMFYFYFESIMIDFENGNEKNCVCKMDLNVIGFVNNILVSKVVCLVIVWMLVKFFLEFGLFLEIVVEWFVCCVFNVVMVLQLMGMDQKCVFVVCCLKVLDFNYYVIFYVV